MALPLLPSRPDLTSPAVRAALPVRKGPHWSLIMYGRHIGLQKLAGGRMFWMARFRTAAGRYCQRRLGVVRGTAGGLSHAEALAAAEAWFAADHRKKPAAEARRVGVQQHLRICPIGEEFAVAHALHDYVEWKRLAAARSHFETNLSLINYHIVPRIADIPLERFNGLDLRKFALEVLETPPKRGNESVGQRRPFESLDVEELRKRKKTLNTLISILRVAFLMAWENGRIDSERAWRCLRRVPHADRPRLQFLDRAQCRRLLACCPPDLRLLVKGALFTGCRVSELVRLQVADFGREGRGIRVLSAKSSRSRFVFLPDEGVEFFRVVCADRPPDETLFLRQDGRKWGDAYKHRFRLALSAAGLPRGFVFHGLRHTYASQLVSAGTPLAIVASQLGHASVATVSTTYGHIAPQVRESEVRRRFEALEPSEHAIDEVAGDRGSARQEQRPAGSLDQCFTAEPRSNFYRCDGELLRLTRSTNRVREP